VSIITLIRSAISLIGLVREVHDEISREKAREQAKLAPARKEMSDIYREASNKAGKK
jgi:hypothetical protein